MPSVTERCRCLNKSKHKEWPKLCFYDRGCAGDSRNIGAEWQRMERKKLNRRSLSPSSAAASLRLIPCLSCNPRAPLVCSVCCCHGKVRKWVKRTGFFEKGPFLCGSTSTQTQQIESTQYGHQVSQSNFFTAFCYVDRNRVYFPSLRVPPRPCAPLVGLL